MNSIKYIKLGEVAMARGGSGFPQIYQGGSTGVPFIKVSDMNLPGNERFINKSNNYLEQYLIKRLNISVFPKDSIVFAKVGAALLLNRRRLLAVEMAIDNNMMAVTCQGIDVSFLYHYLTSVNFEIFVQPGAVPSINQKHVHDLDVPKFTLKEQKKIAEILTSIDEQIELTEKLIEKKVAQRDGLIHDLMGGDNKWAQSKLCSLAEVVSGGTPSRAVPEYWGGDYPWATPSDITAMPGNYLNTTKDMISEAGLKNSSAKLLPAGSILMTSRATLGESKISLFPVCTNQGFKSLIPRYGVDPAFLMYQMRRMKGLYSNFGIGTTFLEVNKKDTDNFLILIPKSESEQKRISSVFLLMDDEIESEQLIFSKLKAKKLGLMQDLLTGRVRVN